MEKREQLIKLLTDCTRDKRVSSTADKILFLFDEPKEEQVLRTKTPPLPPRKKQESMKKQHCDICKNETDKHIKCAIHYVIEHKDLGIRNETISNLCADCFDYIQDIEKKLSKPNVNDTTAKHNNTGKNMIEVAIEYDGNGTYTAYMNYALTGEELTIKE